MTRYFNKYPIMKESSFIHVLSNMKDQTAFRFAKAMYHVVSSLWGILSASSHGTRLRNMPDMNKSTLIQRLLVHAGPGEVVCKFGF